MKRFDRETKEYVTEEEYARRYSNRNKKTCRGGRPHDYVLVLPLWIKTTEQYKLNPVVYYDAMDRIDDFTREQSEELARHGILVRHYGYPSRPRLYVCSVCNKQEYKSERELTDA